ncbi:hypothetical protein Neosp_002858 [[Neocosmospora] mangrovei]
MKSLLALTLVACAGAIPAPPKSSSTPGDCALSETSFSITHIITATSVFHINGVNLLTDPFFSPANTSFPVLGAYFITVLGNPALQPDQVPPIDAVLLSHEDHPDNLDDIGRTHFLDGRKVLTTPDGANALRPRPGVTGLQAWQTIQLNVNGETWNITGTPCKDLPGGQVVGFVLRGPGFGFTNGLPNAIWYSGDTVYLEELSQLKDMFRIRAAVFNMGDAHAIVNDTELKITMDGTDVARLFKAVGADILVPMHYNPWSHFKETVSQLKKDLEAAGVADRTRWLVPGQRTRIF